MDKMQRAMAIYVKSISKRAEGADKEKQLPGGHLGSSMVTHGEDFETDSEFGNCLSCMQSPLSPPRPSAGPRANDTDCEQLLAAQTSALLACRRHMHRALRHPGWRASTAGSSR